MFQFNYYDTTWNKKKFGNLQRIFSLALCRNAVFKKRLCTLNMLQDKLLMFNHKTTVSSVLGETSP